MSNISIVNKLFESRSVILEMLNDRNYNIENYINYNQDEINVLYTQSTKTSVENNPIDIQVSKGSHKLLLKYVLNKIRISNICNLVTELVEDYEENDTIILVIKDKLNNKDTLEKCFDNILTEKKIFVQLFELDKLMYNVTKHVLVPKHKILNDGEKHDLLTRYSLSSYNQLPIILKTDPVAQYIGMKNGDVCEITRASQTHGIYTNYRYCE